MAHFPLFIVLSSPLRFLPFDADALECPECHKMTPVRTAVAYATVDLRFMYIEGGMPESRIAVLGAWTNGDDFHVEPSVWDDGEQRWIDRGNCFASDADYQMYAWAEWPEAPPL